MFDPAGPRCVYIATFAVSQAAQLYQDIGSYHLTDTNNPAELIAHTSDLLYEWAICILQPGIRKLSLGALQSAQYVDFPGSPLPLHIVPKKSSNTASTNRIVTVKYLGLTDCADDAVTGFRKTLYENWGDSYQLLWSSQHYSIFLSSLLLDSGTKNITPQQLKNLLYQIEGAHDAFAIGRHIACMGMMCTPLAIGAWVFAGASMFSMDSKRSRRHENMLRLKAVDFGRPMFEALLQLLL